MSRFDDPLQLLQEDMKDDDHQIVMKAVNRLATIGIALGQGRCRTELIPFLQAYVEDDNDEVHCAIARQLGDFAPLVGGNGTAHVSSLLPLLEVFVAEEETVIRDAGVASLEKIMPSLLTEHRTTHLFPLIKRLAAKDWFTSRCSACKLTTSAYKLVSSELQQQMRAWFVLLCHDDTPMVQAAAFQALPAMSVAMDSKSFIADMLPVLREVSTHDMDYLRVWAVDTCISVSSILSKEDYKSKIVPIISNIQDDTSWRVRSRLAEKMSPMIKALQEQKNQALVESTLLPIYAALLIDRETEVRLHAVAQLPTIAEALKGCAALVEHLHQSLAALTNDQEANVRLGFAKTLVPLCNAFPRDAGGKLLLPLMQSMANDDQHSVRRAVVEELHALTDNNGILTQMVPQVLSLASDPKWRVRMSAIGKAGLLAEALGQRVFERKVQEVLIVSLSDHVSAIREKACEQSGKVVAAFGGTWAGERFFPAAFSIYNPNKNYLHRMTCLNLISCICDEKVTGEGPRDCFQTTFLDLLCQAFSDEVANVRLMACQTLFKMLSKLTDSQIQTRVAPAIRTLAGDTDSDVSYFASVCQEAIAKTS